MAIPWLIAGAAVAVTAVIAASSDDSSSGESEASEKKRLERERKKEEKKAREQQYREQLDNYAEVISKEYGLTKSQAASVIVSEDDIDVVPESFQRKLDKHNEKIEGLKQAMTYLKEMKNES